MAREEKMENSFENILKTCRDGISINVDRDQIAPIYYDYLKLFPTLSGAKYMIADERNKKLRLLFFMEENAVEITGGKFELFPIKNRIVGISIHELTLADPNTRKHIQKISFSFRTDFGFEVPIEEDKLKVKIQYLVRMLNDYLFPNLKKEN
jgi:hypothetical protein